MSLHGYSDGEYDDGSDVDNVTLISKLDVSHPLHLHPNDFVALTVVSVKLKGTENYQVWSCAMLLASEGKNKTGFIDGSCRRSNTDEIFSKRAKHVWDELKETYDKEDGSVTFSLHHKIHILSQNGSSIADYYHKLNALWKQFDALIELPRCTCHAADDFKKHNQLMKLMQFLMGLDNTYMQIRSSILSRETLPDVRSAYAIISSEESHRIATEGIFRGLKPLLVSLDLLIITDPMIIRIGELLGVLPWKRKVGSNFKGKNVSNNVVGSSSSNGFSDEQMATLISLIKENSINRKGIHSNMAGTYMNSSTVFNKNFKKFFSSNSSLHSKLVSKGLITDSCANQHITYTDKNLINVIDVSYLKIKVTHPNGTEAFITRMGNMPLTDYLTLYDVLVDLRKGKILRTGKQIGGLYYFDGNQAKQTKEPFPLSDHVSTELSELVHLDLWGPYKVTSREGLPTSVLNGKSPYDLVYNKPSSLKHLRSFGCLPYATILNSHDKFGNHLNFLNFNTLNDLPEIPNDEERRNPCPIRYGNSPSHSGRTSASSNENGVRHSQDADDFASENESFAADEDKNTSFEGNDLHDQNQDNVCQDNNNVQNLIRSSRTSVFPKNCNGFIVYSKVKHGLEKYVNYSYLSKGNYCFATMLSKGIEPKTYVEASQHKHWVDAMNAEMDALYRTNTWEIVDLPVGRKAIGSKWVWKIKYKSDGEIERYKARCLINLAVQSGWSLFQMDINNAFLYGDLEETVYMTLPPGYFLAKETKSKSDYSLFTKSFGDVFIALLVYVDDIIITGNSLAEIEKVKQFLKTKFMIKDLGKLKYFLGIKVLDTPKGICLNQRKYCLELIDEFRLHVGKPSNLPMQPNISLTSEPGDTDPLLDNVTGYQKLIGKLIYLTTTRPNIAYTVFCLSQFMHNPLKSHLKIALKVIMYLKGSPGKGINVIKGSASSIDLKAYSDADWARCANTRRSTTGYCVLMCGSLVS
ncbi:ribonuclease H-like domain-containing protein [Tanacetum coccineum]